MRYTTGLVALSCAWSVIKNVEPFIRGLLQVTAVNNIINLIYVLHVSSVTIHEGDSLRPSMRSKMNGLLTLPRCVITFEIRP